MNNLVFVLSRGEREEGHSIKMVKSKRNGNDWVFFDESEVEQEFFMKDEYIIIPVSRMEDAETIKNMELSGKVLKDYANVNFGMQLRNRKIYADDVTSDKESLTEFHKPCYTGKNIDEYFVHYDGLYCYFKPDEAKCGGCWDAKAQFANPKLLVRQIGIYPIVGIDEKGYAVLNTAFMISGFKEDVSPYYLLGLLNSTLIKFYWKQKFSDNRKQFPKIKGMYLEKLPIIRNKEIENEVEKAIKGILANENSDISSIRKEIDDYIFQLYSIKDRDRIYNTMED